MLAIDFDDTLNFSNKNNDKYEPNFDLIRILKENIFFILTARNETPENIIRVKEFVNKFDIKPKMIIFTNNKEKGPFLKTLSESNDISVLVDDKEYQRNSAKEYGFVGYHPDDFVSSYSETFTSKESKSMEKISRYIKIKKMWSEV